MFFTKEDRDALKENTKDIKSLDGVVYKNIVQVNDLIPRINMLEAHVKSLLSKNEDMSAKMYELDIEVLSLQISESQDDEEEDKHKNDKHKYGTK